MAVKFLDYTGLGYFWSKIKAWCNATFAAITHNHASSAVNAMTGYSKPSSTSAIAASDTLNSAIGKLEKAIDDANINNVIHITGNETITGQKSFTSSTKLVGSTLGYRYDDTIFEKNTTLSENQYRWLVIHRDINENRNSGVYFTAFTTGVVQTALIQFKQDTDDSTMLSVGWDANGYAYGKAPSTSIQRNDGNDILTRNWIPSDTRIVHTTGNEVISGLKIFNSSESFPDTTQYSNYSQISEILLANDTITKGTLTSDRNSYTQFVCTDSTRARETGRTLSIFYKHPSVSNPEPSAQFAMDYINSNNASKRVKIAIGYDPDDDIAYAIAPSTSSVRTGTTDIVTRDWIPRDTRIVHASGNENITGVKYFNDSVYIKHPNLVKGTNPSAISYKQLNFIGDADSTAVSSCVGCLENFVNTSGTTETTIRAYNYVANSTTYERIAIIYPKNGTPYTYAPTPSDLDDNSNKIATTAWAFNKVALYKSATQDLNDYKTPGSYLLNSNGSTTVISNIPEGKNGTLLVFGNNTNGQILRQIFFRWGTNNSNDHHVFIRQYRGVANEWSTWTRLLTDKDIISIANGGTGATTASAALTNLGAAAASHTHSYLPLSGGTTTGSITATITESPGFLTKNSDLTKGTNPSNDTWSGIAFGDKTGNGNTYHRVGAVESKVTSSGDVYTYVRAYKWAADVNSNQSIGIVYNKADDSASGFAPTPAATSNTFHIATTAWVRTFCNTTQKYATLNTEQTFTESKWFTGGSYCLHSTIVKGTAPSSNAYESFGFYDKNKQRVGGIEFCFRSSGSMDTKMFTNAKDTDRWCTVSCQAVAGTTDVRNFFPDGNGIISLGTSGNRWKQLFAATTTISTSDERLKSNIENVSDNLLDAWEELEFVTFKFNDAIESKGIDKARTHSGLIAQRIKSVLEKYNIDGNQYGFLCWDHWEDSEVDYDQETGRQISTFIPAGDAYSLRYEEVLCIEAAYQRRKNKILENRISELERQVSDMLQILQSLKGAN